MAKAEKKEQKKMIKAEKKIRKKMIKTRGQDKTNIHIEKAWKKLKEKFLLCFFKLYRGF